MKLLITGGHITPALAIIDEIRRQNKPIDLIFVGRKHANNKDKAVTFEYSEIQMRDIPFYPLTTGRVTRQFSLRTLHTLVLIPYGFVQAYTFLKKTDPDAVLSFGGYIALPVAIMARMLGIPVFTHEQTIYPGLGNRIIGWFASVIFVSFPQTVSFFPSHKVEITGNPIRQSVFKPVHAHLHHRDERKVLYVTGGSLGAHSVNVMIEQIVEKLVEKYTVIHQVGNVQEFNDYERLKSKRDQLPEHLKKYYHLQPHFFDKEIGYIYNIADLVIGRSGANTFFELAVLKKPALFIPLPLSAHQEQQKHAKIFQLAGVGEVYEGENPTELLALITKMTDNLQQYEKNFTKLPSYYAENAAQKIVEYIYSS